MDIIEKRFGKVRRTILLSVISAAPTLLGANAAAEVTMAPHACFPANMDKAFLIDWNRVGIVNVSDSVTVWVFCPAPKGFGEIADFAVRVFNLNQGEESVRCVLRETDPFLNVVKTITRNTSLPGGFAGGATWFDVIPEDSTLNSFGVACELPPGTGVGNIVTNDY